MDGRPPERSMLRRAYDAYLRHKNALAYWHLAIIATGVIVGTRSEVVGRAVVVPAVFSLILIVVETLTRVDSNVSEGLARLEGTVARFFRPEAFVDGTFAESTILELVDESKASPITIDIVAATGGSNLPFLRQLRRRARTKRIVLNLYLMEPGSPTGVSVPEHWADETKTTLTCLRNEFVGSDLDVRVHLYPHLPALRAVLVDHEHLLLGFFRWMTMSEDDQPFFAGAEGPHRLYRKGDPDTPHYVQLVEDWLRHAPKRQVAPEPIDR